MSKEIQKVDNRVLTDHGLNLPEDITEDQFFEVGSLLGNIEKGMQWATGDWYNGIKWGDKQVACERVGLNFRTARECGAVADIFQFDTRGANLTFKHHRVLLISDLSDHQRRDLLEKAEIGEAMKNGKMKPWSSKRLLEERDKLLGWWEEPIQVDDSDALEEFMSKVGEGIPDRYKKKVKRLAQVTAKQLADDFESQVTAAVSEKVKSERNRFIEMRKQTDAERNRLESARQRVTQIMTKKEFQLVRSCLHPDKHDGDPRYGKAFEVFNRMLETIDSKTYEAWSE